MQSAVSRGRVVSFVPMNSAGRSTWTDPMWRAAILAWATGEALAHGHRVDGEIEQPHIRPWSTVFRIPTDRGVLWCKGLGPGTAHEAPLLAALGGWGRTEAVEPLAVDGERGWVLSPDGGPTLRMRRPDGTGDRDLGAWERILRRYADLQRSMERHCTELLAMGVPDGRPETLPATLDRLLDDDEVWDPSRMTAEDRADTSAARAALRRAGGWVARRSAVLEASGIPPTIQHDDLHGGNIFVGDGGVRFFDWGDAVLAHPFGTLTVTLNSIAYATDLGADDPALRRLRAAYLEAWSDVRPLDELEAIAEAAIDLGRISRAAAWARALTGVAPGDLEDHGGAPAAWLADLAERMTDRAAG
jgi:Phosphotransferase enzyme family